MYFHLWFLEVSSYGHLAYFFGSHGTLDGKVWLRKHAHLMVASKRNSRGMGTNNPFMGVLSKT